MEQSLKEAIKEFVQAYRLDEKLNKVRLSIVWEKLMGKTIATHTIELYIAKKKLYIKFDSAALRSELSYAKEKVIKMINEEMGEEVVEDIVFR